MGIALVVDASGHEVLHDHLHGPAVTSGREEARDGGGSSFEILTPTSSADGVRRRCRRTAGGCCSRAAPASRGVSVFTTSRAGRRGCGSPAGAAIPRRISRIVPRRGLVLLFAPPPWNTLPTKNITEPAGIVASSTGVESSGRLSTQRWLPGTTRVAPFASVKSSSGHMVLSTTSGCGRGDRVDAVVACAAPAPSRRDRSRCRRAR